MKVFVFVLAVASVFAAIIFMGHHEKYEYRILAISDPAFTRAMNALGQDGWELVSARRASTGGDTPVFSYEVIMKRKLTMLGTENDNHSSDQALLTIESQAQEAADVARRTHDDAIIHASQTDTTSSTH